MITKLQQLHQRQIKAAQKLQEKNIFEEINIVHTHSIDFLGEDHPYSIFLGECLDKMIMSDSFNKE